MAVTVPGAELMLANPISTRQVLPWWLYLHTIGGGTVDNVLSGRHYHLYVRGNGSFVQRQDLLLRSAASVEMNPYSIAIVAEDAGPHFSPWSGSNVPAYTPQQVATLILIISWICHRFGIPKNAVHTSCINEDHGVGWHRLGIDGNFPNQWPYWGRQPGCLETSLSTGKPCPGNARITQIVHDIMPAVSAPEDWFDMATKAEVAALIKANNDEVAAAAAKAVWDRLIDLDDPQTPEGKHRAWVVLRDARNLAQRAAAQETPPA